MIGNKYSLILPNGKIVDKLVGFDNVSFDPELYRCDMVEVMHEGEKLILPLDEPWEIGFYSITSDRKDAELCVKLRKSEMHKQLIELSPENERALVFCVLAQGEIIIGSLKYAMEEEVRMIISAFGSRGFLSAKEGDWAFGECSFYHSLEDAKEGLRQGIQKIL